MRALSAPEQAAHGAPVKAPVHGGRVIPSQPRPKMSRDRRRVAQSLISNSALGSPPDFGSMRVLDLARLKV